MSGAAVFAVPRLLPMEHGEGWEAYRHRLESVALGMVWNPAAGLRFTDWVDCRTAARLALQVTRLCAGHASPVAFVVRALDPSDPEDMARLDTIDGRPYFVNKTHESS